MRKKAANLGQNDGKDKAGAAVPAESPDAAAGGAGEEKPVFNQIAYQNEYNRQKYDRVNLTMPKGKKEKVRSAAAAQGMSVNQFINHLIDRAFEEADTIREAITSGDYNPFYIPDEEEKRYYYGMRLRGFSIGCQPMDEFMERVDDTTGKYHDILIYRRKLTEKELTDYELDFIAEKKIEEAGAAE